MKATEDLFQLIKSLSKNEKGYFKKYASRHAAGRENNYLKLFDAIEQQKQYEEQAIKTLFRKEKFIRHLPSEKNYLYHLILRSLNEYYTGSSVDARIKEMLRNVEILSRKGLHEQCKKMLHKARRAAELYKKNIQLLDIIDWEKRVMVAESYQGKTEKDFKKISGEEETLLQKIKNTSDYWRFSAHVFGRFSRMGISRSYSDIEPLKELIRKAHISDEKRATSYHSLVYFYHTCSFYYLSRADFSRSYTYNRKLVELMEQHPHQVKENLPNYIAALNNMLLTCNRLKEYATFDKYLEKLRNLPAGYHLRNTDDAAARIFVRSYMLETDMYIGKGDFRKGLLLENEVLKGLSDYSGQITHRGHLFTLCYNMAYLSFGTANYVKARSWINRILNHKEVSLSEDILCYARILNLITHFESGNEELLSYIHKSTFHYLYRKQRLYELENVFTGFMRKIAALALAERKDAFVQFRKKLLQLKENSFEKQAFDYFDFISWADSKINNRPFVEVYLKNRN